MQFNGFPLGSTAVLYHEITVAWFAGQGQVKGPAVMDDGSGPLGEQHGSSTAQWLCEDLGLWILRGKDGRPGCFDVPIRSL